jgi:hypothetical protein
MTNNNNSNLSEEQLNKISQRAKRDRAIKLQDLIYIMAADESYNDILPELWDIFDLNKAKNNRIPQLKYGNGRLDKNGNLKSKEDRVGAWWWLWARLAIITEIDEFYFKELPPVINSLPLYCFTRGELINVKDGNKRKEDHFVKLNDLEAFLNDIKREYDLTLPLPSRFFPDRREENETPKTPFFPEKVKLEDAINYGYTTLDRLPSIMAKEKGYADIIPMLWEKYQCDLQGPKEPKVTTEQDRIITWQKLFQAMPSLPFHSAALIMELGTRVTYIQLQELKKYFTETIKIPLPVRLFTGREHEKIKIGEALTGQEIMDKYGIKDFQLLHCIREELTKKWDIDGYKAKLRPYSPLSLQPIHVCLFYTIGTGPAPTPFDIHHNQEVDHVEDLLPYIPDCVFKQSEAEKTLKKYGCYPNETTDKKPIEQDEVKELTAHEDFIRNLNISYESDLVIKIQEPKPKKSSNLPDYKKLGFKHEETKEWKDFLGILREPNHAYYLSPAYIYSLDGSRKIRTRNKSYDRKRKRLEAINKKLIDFFNDNYPVNIPEGYKLYEPCQIQKKRGYTFKFQMVDTTTMNGNLESEYNSYTRDQLINRIKGLGKKYIEISKFKDNEVEANNFLEMFNIAAIIALQKDWITKDRITDMLDLKKYKEVYSDVKEKPVKSIDHT